MNKHTLLRTPFLFLLTITFLLFHQALSAQRWIDIMDTGINFYTVTGQQPLTCT